MGTFDVIGHIGGVSGALFKIATFLVAYYSKISFRVSLINLMYSVSYKGRSKDSQDSTMKVSFCNKLKLITNLCPNKKMKKFIQKGNKQLEKDFDLMEIIKQHKLHQKHLKDQVEDIPKHDLLNIDSDSMEEGKRNISDPK